MADNRNVCSLVDSGVLAIGEATPSGSGSCPKIFCLGRDSCFDDLGYFTRQLYPIVHHTLTHTEGIIFNPENLYIVESDEYRRFVYDGMCPHKSIVIFEFRLGEDDQENPIGVILVYHFPDIIPFDFSDGAGLSGAHQCRRVILTAKVAPDFVSSFVALGYHPLAFGRVTIHGDLDNDEFQTTLAFEPVRNLRTVHGMYEAQVAGSDSAFCHECGNHISIESCYIEPHSGRKLCHNMASCSERARYKLNSDGSLNKFCHPSTWVRDHKIKKKQQNMKLQKDLLLKEFPSLFQSPDPTILQRDLCFDAAFKAANKIIASGVLGEGCSPLKEEDRENCGRIFDAQFDFGKVFDIGVVHDIGDNASRIVADIQGTLKDLVDRIPTLDGLTSVLSDSALCVWDKVKNMSVLFPAIILWIFSVYKYGSHILDCQEKGIEPSKHWHYVSLIAVFIVSYRCTTKVIRYMQKVQRGLELYAERATPEAQMTMTAAMWCTHRNIAETLGGKEGRDDYDEAFAHEMRKHAVPGVGRGFDAQINDTSDINRDVASLVLSALSFAAIGKAPEGRKLDKFLSTVGSIPRASNGVTEIISSIMALLQRAINFVRSDMLGMRPYTWLASVAPDVDSWCERVQNIVDESRKPSWVINQTNAIRVGEIWKEGNSMFLGKYSSVLESTRVRSALTAYMAVLKKLLVPFEQANIAGVAPRMRPITVFLGGASGVGKSNLSIPLVNAVLTKVLPTERLSELEDNYMDFIYNRQSEQDYWDRYFGQTACVFDDFMQRRDSIGDKDSEIMDIIRCTNMFPNVLHMAALENKGTTVFRSRFILATSNTFSMNVESITHKEALTSRFNYVYRVAPALRWCVDPSCLEVADRRLNVGHPELVGAPARMDIYEFHEMRWSAGGANPTGHCISFDQLVDLLSKSYETEERRSELYNVLIKEDISARIKARLATAQVFEEETDPELDEDSDYAVAPEDAKTIQMLVADADNEDVDSLVSDLGSLKASDLVQSTMEVVDDNTFGSLLDLNVGLVNIDFVASLVRHSDPRLQAWSSVQIFRGIGMMVPTLWEEMLSSCGSSSRPERVFMEFMDLLIASKQWTIVIEGMVIRNDAVAISDAEIASLGGNRTSIANWFARIASGAKSFVYKYPIITFLGLFASIFGMYKVGTAVYRLLVPEDVGESILPLATGSDRLVPLVPEVSGAKGKGRKGKHRQKTASLKESSGSSKVYHQTYWDGGEWFGQVNSNGQALPNVPYRWEVQGGGDLNSLQIAARVVRKSSYAIYLPWTGRRIGSVVFICGNVAVMPFHFIRFLKNSILSGDCAADTEVHLVNKAKPDGYFLKVSDMLDYAHCSLLEDMDLCTFRAPIHVHRHANILSMFVDPKFLGKPIDLTVHCIIHEDDGGWRVDSGVATPIKGFSVRHRDEVWKVNTGYSYPFPTLAGDCGSLVVLNNKAVGPGKIVGMHIAGAANSVGIATAFDRGVADLVMEQWTVFDAVACPDEILADAQLMDLPYVNGSQVPLITLERGVSQASTTKILRSSLYEAWGPAITSPAHLRPFECDGVVVDPRAIGLMGYCVPGPRLDDNILDAVVACLASRFVTIGSKSGFYQPKVFSFDDAVQGVPGMDFCDPIDRSTSPGYPFVLDRPATHPGKTWWFGSAETFDLSRPQAIALRQRVRFIEDQARKYVRCLHVFPDFPKDERRVLAKVLVGKTRSISSCPLDYSIIFRMYFLDFAIFLMKNRMACGACVGINPRSAEWHILATFLNRFGKVIAGDFEGFDKRQTVALLEAVLRIINMWYNDAYQDIRRVLFLDIYNSIHLFKGCLILWVGSLPSGNPLTVIINCVVHMIVMAYVWTTVHPTGLHGLQFFHDHVEMQVYGDDGVMSVSDLAIDFFNQVTISCNAHLLNMVYTSEDKLLTDVPFRQLSDVSFLKRKFRYEEAVGRYVAPLCLDTVMEMAYWTRDGQGERAITEDNVKVALMELSLHGEQVFDSCSQKIICACRDRMDWLPPATTWRSNLQIATVALEQW